MPESGEVCEKRKLWINIYKTKVMIYFGSIYLSGISVTQMKSFFQLVECFKYVGLLVANGIGVEK